MAFSSLRICSAAPIFVVDPEDAPLGSIAIFAEVYQLKMAERQVLERLAAGYSPAEIAEILGIGMSTVRTHPHQIFDKTGARRQGTHAHVEGAGFLSGNGR